MSCYTIKYSDFFLGLFSFKNARTIAPLYTSGAVAITSDGMRLVTCVEEDILLTNVENGLEICRFVGVRWFLVILILGLINEYRILNLSTHYASHLLPRTSWCSHLLSHLEYTSYRIQKNL